MKAQKAGKQLAKSLHHIGCKVGLEKLELRMPTQHNWSFEYKNHIFVSLDKKINEMTEE